MADTPKLKRVARLDSVPLEKAQYTDEGYLVDNPIVTSCGIFDYHNKDGSVRRELRLPEHVFDKASLETYKGKPVVLTHDAGRVTKDNVAENIIGTILSIGKPDGDDVRAEIVIHDIDELKQSRLKELSLGYDLVLDETPGEWNGQPYDAIQTEIVINHLAVVREARAGEQARLNIDSKTKIPKGESTMAKPTNKKKAMNADEMAKTVAAFETRRKARLDGEDEPSAIPEKIIIEGVVKPQEGAADGEGATESAEGEKKEMTLEEKVQEVKDRRDRRDQEGDPEDVDGAKSVIAQQDEDISCLMELLSKLQAAKDFGTAAPVGDGGEGGNADEDDGGNEPAKGDKPMNADSVDAIVSEKLKLARIGDRLNIDGLESVKPLEAKKRIAKAIKPTMNLDGKDANYVNAAFDLAMSELNTRKGTDYQRKQMFNADSASKPAAKSGASAARERMTDKILNGGNE